MESMGFVFGIMGFVIGAAALSQVKNLKKEFDQLRQSLEDSGVLKTQQGSEKK